MSCFGVFSRKHIDCKASISCNPRLCFKVTENWANEKNPRPDIHRKLLVQNNYTFINKLHSISHLISITIDWTWHHELTWWDDQSIWTAWTRPQHPLLEDSQVFCPFICFSMSTTRAASISENAIARVASSTSGCEPTAVHSNRFLCISKWRNSQRRSLKPIKSGHPDSCSKKGCFLVSTIVLNHYKVWRTLINVLILFFSVLYCSVSAGVASAISCATNRCTGRRCDLAHFNSSCSHNHLHNCFSSVPAQTKRIVLVLLPPGSSSQEKGNGLQGSGALGPHRHASVLDSPGDHRYPGCHSGVIFQRTLSYHLLVYQHASWG